MDWQSVGTPIAAVCTAILTYMGTRHIARVERSREEARLAEAARDEALVVEQALSTAHEQAQAAIIMERNELLERWQRTLDEARDDRQRLLQEHRSELARVRQETRDEVAGVRESAQLVIADLRGQIVQLRAEVQAVRDRQRPGSSDED
ncbi:MULTISPECIES: hypothetical protein [unclassified Micromonospora]|uniref:hypothetical protein n=1 Tax=Micromonospora TaxID=1873 RepID=UPI001C222088|nr:MULTISPECIES: hypothetical protein [unclassified Micromonospora]MBU8860301.1 hypothetical protein [Micromonospora sp. WMMB482]MDM4779835.1 hypothetical protein [Micromonospora sp. b486]